MGVGLKEIVANIFWTEKNIFGEAACRWWSSTGPTPGARTWGIVVNIFWTEKNIFGEGGLPVVVEHGFHPSGPEAGGIVVNIFWTEKNIFVGEA